MYIYDSLAMCIIVVVHVHVFTCIIDSLILSFYQYYLTIISCLSLCGPVAQRIRHLTTNQGIPGSNPGRVVFFFFLFNVQFHTAGNTVDFSVYTKTSYFYHPLAKE